jgi:leucyl aminopeptidase
MNDEPKAQPETAAEEEVGDETEADYEGQEADAADNSEDDGEEPDTEDDEDEESEETDAQETPKTFSVKVDGKETQVTLDELKRSFSGNAYIQKGMQEAAAVRKEAENLYYTLQNERQQFLATLENVQQQGIMKAPQAPDIRMLDSDPIGYMQEKAKYEVRAQEFQAQQRQLHEQSQRQTALQEQARQVELQEQARLLIEAIPEFAHPEKAAALKTNLVQFASKYRLSAEEVASTVDSRLVRVLYDAYRYDQLSAVKDKAKKPEPPRNVKPTPRKPAPDKIVRDRQMKAAKRSGKPEAFIDLLFR